MTHLRAKAVRNLALIFSERIKLLTEVKRVSLGDVCGSLGRRPFNVVMSGHAHTLPRGLVVRALEALELPVDEKNHAMVQVPLVFMPEDGQIRPRRRSRKFYCVNRRR
ncbi:MAG: hypothetical protein WAX44_04355 [Minisyncoccia bacterium]